ncbi:MAG: 30S ribosomal protein S14 [Gammaproteobacteria bacterium]|nr:30S ribosomal protein S14 [Gammaproteobacteria bacterium]
MATTRMIAREKARKKAADGARVTRDALRNITKDLSVDYDEKMIAVVKLNKQDRDKSPCRGRNRCNICGRPRGVYRKFGLCRLCLRKAVMFGHVPGAKKASW